MILAIKNDLLDFEKIDSTSFGELNIWERTHIQEWIRNAPEILGEELLVVSIEFDKFTNSNDRLDLLALDKQGNLVVIELKRDAFAGYSDLQSIRYAAMVSSMTIDKLLPYYISYQKKYLGKNDANEEESITYIEEFINQELSEELSNKPRIILCSENFSQEVTTTVLWLNQNGLDISCVRITPHKIGNQIVVVPNKIIPLQEAKQYLIDIQQKEEKIHDKKKNIRKKTLKILLENNIIKEGEKIYLKHALPKYLHFKKDDPNFIATITGKLDQSNSVRWEQNGEEYAISRLTVEIFRNNNPEKKDPGGVNGNWHWVTEKGKDLWTLAEEFINQQTN